MKEKKMRCTNGAKSKSWKETAEMNIKYPIVNEAESISDNECNTKITIEKMTEEAIETTKKANQAIENLAKARAENKLSNSRVTSVARELRELIKVLSLYSC